MTEAQAKARLEVARREARRYARLRNIWRRLVKRRLHRLREIREKSRVRFIGNQVVGGTSVEQRFAYLVAHAPSIFRLYYDETEPFAGFLWAVLNVPRNRWRSDCSSWSQDVIRAVKASSPLAAKIITAGSAFFTGWVVANCPQVDRDYARSHPGTAVVYGTGTGFHMGLSHGDGTESTTEHGTANLDAGSFNEFGAGTEVRFFQFLT